MTENRDRAILRAASCSRAVGMAGTVAASFPAGMLVAAAEGRRLRSREAAAAPPPREALEDAHRGGVGHAGGHRRAADSDRRERAGRRRGPRGALHRPRARRTAGRPRARPTPPVSPRSTPTRRTRKARRSRSSPAQDQDAVLTEMEKNAATGLHAELVRVLQPRSRAHDTGHVLRSLLRRQRQLRRLGPDRLSRRAHGGHRGRAAHGRRAVKPNHKSAYDDAMFAKRGGGHGH